MSAGRRGRGGGLSSSPGWTWSASRTTWASASLDHGVAAGEDEGAERVQGAGGGGEAEAGGAGRGAALGEGEEGVGEASAGGGEAVAGVLLVEGASRAARR